MKIVQFWTGWIQRVERVLYANSDPRIRWLLATVQYFHAFCGISQGENALFNLTNHRLTMNDAWATLILCAQIKGPSCIVFLESKFSHYIIFSGQFIFNEIVENDFLRNNLDEFCAVDDAVVIFVRC